MFILEANLYLSFLAALAFWLLDEVNRAIFLVSRIELLGGCQFTAEPDSRAHPGL
jgi:hypothetical protein